jgi:hypothetical protein
VVPARYGRQANCLSLKQQGFRPAAPNSNPVRFSFKRLVAFAMMMQSNLLNASTIKWIKPLEVIWSSLTGN